MQRDSLGSVFAVAFLGVLVFFGVMYGVCYLSVFLSGVIR